MILPAAAANRALYALALGNFAIATSAFTIAGLLNLLAADLGISVSAAGQLMTVYAVAYAIGAPFLTVFSGRMSRRDVVLMGLVLAFGGVLASALAQGTPMLYVARLFVAFGAAVYTSTAALIALTVSEPSRRIRGLSLVITGLTIAQIVGVPLGTYVGGALGWRWGMALGAPAAVAAIIMVARWVPRDIAFHAPSFSSFGDALRDWKLCLVIGLTLLTSSGQNLIAVYLGPIIIESTGADSSHLSLILLVFGAAGLAGNLAGGAMADRVGPVKTLIAFLSLSVAATALIPWMNGSHLAAALVMSLWAFGTFAFNPAQQARVVAFAPTASGVALSLNATAIYAGIAIGASAGGGVIAWQGTRGLAPACLVVIVASIALIYYSERKLGRPGQARHS